MDTFDMLVEILINDASGRFQKGEIGAVIENTFPEKYDYFVELPGICDMSILGLGEIPRQYFFYAHEVKMASQKKA